MKNLLAYFLIVIISACGNIPEPARFLSSNTNVSRIEHSTVALVGSQFDSFNYLENSYNGSNSVYCGGVFISPRRILTAGHCVERRDILGNRIGSSFLIPQDTDPSPIGDPKKVVLWSMFQRSSDRQYVVFTVISFDKESDLAILEAEPGAKLPFHVVSSVRTSDLSVGESTFAVGHPGGIYWHISEGIISRQETRLFDAIFLHSTAEVFFGNSGGPLFDNSGRLIGIASSMLFGQNHLGFFSSVKNIQLLETPSI